MIGGNLDLSKFEINHGVSPLTCHPSLPFVIQNTCALGIAVNTYLDAMLSDQSEGAAPIKASVTRNIEERIFIYAEDYAGDIDKAFQLWDAIYAGVNAATPDMFSEKKSFEEANTWLERVR